MNPYKPDPTAGRSTDPRRQTRKRPNKGGRTGGVRETQGAQKFRRANRAGYTNAEAGDIMTEAMRRRSVKRHITGRDEVVLYGRHVVTRAIEKYPGLLTFIFAREDEVAYYRELGKKYGTHCPIHVGTDQELDKKARGGIHQGVIASIPDFPYAPLDSIIGPKQVRPGIEALMTSIVLVLDEVQDPQNVGALVRSAVALGAGAVVLPEHDQVGITGVVARTSVGAVFDIPIVRVTSLAQTLEKLKEKGFWVVGLAGEEGSTPIGKYEFSEPTVLVLGSEGSGLRTGTRNHCDVLLSIPQTDQVESLNVSVAGAIALYEAGKTLVFKGQNI